MSMLDEIENMMTDLGASIRFRIVNLANRCIYLEGIKCVVSLSEKNMLFQLKGGECEISGEGLKIKYLDKTSCVVEGRILNVGTR